MKKKELSKYDKEHQKLVVSLQAKIERIYKRAIEETEKSISSGKISADKEFNLSDYPIIQKRINKLLETLKNDLSSVIVDGVQNEWTLSNRKNDELCKIVFGDRINELPKNAYRKYFTNNTEALNSFLQRKEKGLNLSDRVWNYTKAFKNEIELALKVGIEDGQSADEISRDLRSYLKYPDKLFRRVKKDGKLQLSKAAKAFHPGRGVYRSSYMNARRLAATETNIAYRTADYERWKKFDFVVGIEIELSNNHTCKGVPHFADICDELQGKYPKNFKFTGWHPHCRCHATPILKSVDELAEDTERIMNGEQPKKSQEEIKQPNAKFVEWVNANKERIIDARKEGKAQYFVRDNEKIIDNILSKKKIKTSKLTKILPTKTLLTKVQNLKLRDVIKNITAYKVEYRDVIDLPQKLTEEMIIQRVGGGDLTSGSCASLAFAYAANKIGYDVLDFRGGNSLNFFSRRSNITDIARNVGGIIEENASDFTNAIKLLSHVEAGHEYYFTCGKHAAIIRKTKKGYEYLELQAVTDNGFHKLDKYELKWRFKAKNSHSLYGMKYKTKDVLIDIEKLRDTDDFREMLGYINTEESKQQKGAKGRRK